MEISWYTRIGEEDSDGLTGDIVRHYRYETHRLCSREAEQGNAFRLAFMELVERGINDGMDMTDVFEMTVSMYQEIPNGVPAWYFLRGEIDYMMDSLLTAWERSDVPG